MSSDITFLAPGIAGYVRAHTTAADAIEQQLIEATNALPEAAMQIGIGQARFMGQLTRLLQPRLVIEIGTFTGFSALCVARELPVGSRLIACDVNTEWTAIAQTHWAKAAVDDRIDLRIAPAADTLAALDVELTVDLAFIDADKTGYLGYLEQLIPHMNKRSVVLVDNVLWSGRVLDADDQTDDTVALRHFNKSVVEDPRLEVTMAPIGDGVSIITLAR